MTPPLDKTRRLVEVINDIHLLYSQDYFETGKIDKINLAKTTASVAHILRYRLHLHESINDYLMKQNLSGIDYYYRVKTAESIHDKIRRYSQNTDKYPVNNWMNDIFGARIILDSTTIEQLMELLYDWQIDLGLKNWYLRDKPDYRGLHIYFKNHSNFYFPWELQVWNQDDVDFNIENHRLYKREFVS